MSAFQQQQHLRSDSSDTDSYGSSTGSAYQLILDHILTYPGTYEIPLRTMYTLNCAPRAQPTGFPPRSGTPSSTGSSPTAAQGPAWQDAQTTQSFTENLMTQLQHLPNQPTSLPPSFITSFVRRCFPSDLICVDFPQALTGLDYLKDLETRRRREVEAAMSRLAIDRTTLDLDGDSLQDRYPGVYRWVISMKDKERKVEALYTQMYVALRRWILINELALLPFNKYNCMAMLNTLYPPVVTNQPTSKLTPDVLQQQRQGFFKYIQSVEQKGPRILNKLMEQGKGPDEENGWLAVTRTLGLYLQLANSIISECSEISDAQDVSPRGNRDSAGSRTARKVDSGISFNGHQQHKSQSSSIAETLSPVEPPSRPKTPSGGRSGSALEKLAKGLKTIGRSRTDVTEMVEISAPPQPAAEKAKSLRKMRSLGSLAERKGQGSAFKQPDQPAFDVAAMKSARLKYEADALAAQNFRRRPHHEV